MSYSVRAFRITPRLRELIDLNARPFSPASMIETAKDCAMQTNAVPRYDDSVNTTGCCPKLNPEGWDGQELHFDGKPFVRATTKSLMQVPVNMGKVFGRVHGHIEEAGGYDPDNTIVLSRDISAWKGEHLFAIDKPDPDEEQITLSRLHHEGLGV